MYSWVPPSALASERYSGLRRMASAWASLVGVPADERVERRRGVELDGVQRARPRRPATSTGTSLDVSIPSAPASRRAGSTVTTQTRAPPRARARRRSTRRRSSCRRRPRRRRRPPACRRARRGRRSRRRSSIARSASRQRARERGRPRAGPRRRASSARQREQRAAAAARRAARPRRPRTARARDSKRRAASTAVGDARAERRGVVVRRAAAASAGVGRLVLVDDDVGQRHARAVLDLEGGLDGLVDGELPRERDEQHAAPRGIARAARRPPRPGARTGPPRAAAASPAGEVSSVIACPVAGASTTMRSNPPSRSSAFSLPSTSTSRMPGIAKETTSSAPELRSRRTTAPSECARSHSTSASSGRIRRAVTRAAGGVARPQTRSSQSSCAVEPERPWQLAATLELDGEHAQARGARRRARATAVVVDLPTPPLPATNSTVDRRKNATGSTGGGYRAAAAGPAKNPCSEALSVRRRRRYRCDPGGVPAGRGCGAMAIVTEEWQRHAACKGPRAELFFPPTVPGAQGGPHGARARRQGDLRVVRGA